MKREKGKDVQPLKLHVTTITRKIELVLNDTDNEILNDKYQTLFDMKYQVFKAANTIVNHQYFNHVFASRVKDKSSNPDKKEANKEARKLVEQLYDTSMLNSTYRILSEDFPDLPSAVRTALNMKVVQKYNADMSDVLKGKRTLSNYRLGMPIPFAAGSVGGFKKSLDPDGKEGYRFVFVKGIEFNLRFGVNLDRSDNRAIVDRVCSGEYKFCDSEIKVEDKKLFLMLTVQLPKKVVKLDYNKYAATNLGMNCPVFLTTTDGHKKSIGTKEGFWAVRMQMQRRYTKLQASLTTAKSGHGRTRKLKALDRLQAAEKGFATTYNHKLSKEIVMFCVNNGIGNIKTEDLLGAGKTLNKQIILRNWSYFQLQGFIEYKAKMYNINVIKPTPINITRTCNCCKNVSEEAVDLKERVYVCGNEKCANFAKPIDIDENASLNLLGTEIKPKKEKAEASV